MDDERAIRVIDEWIDLIDQFAATNNDAQWQHLDDQIRGRLRLMRGIALGVDERGLSHQMIEHPDPFDHHWKQARKAAVEVRSIILDREELQAIVGPAGPKLSASSLHPVIWGAAAALWDDGHLRQAVQTAGSALESYLQRTGTYVTGQDLGQLFALTPPTPTVQRLRIEGIDPDSATWTSAHNGAAMLVRGAMMAVRNRVSHEGWPNPEPGPDEALEMLAIFSYVARLVDMSYVDEADYGGASEET